MVGIMLYIEVILYLFLCVFPTDLNNDGCLTYKDFLWAKDKICYMSGWKIDSPKYKITEALFHEIWESLEIIADVDKDGKITKTEWVIKAFHLRCSTFTSQVTKVDAKYFYSDIQCQSVTTGERCGTKKS